MALDTFRGLSSLLEGFRDF